MYILKKMFDMEINSLPLDWSYAVIDTPANYSTFIHLFIQNLPQVCIHPIPRPSFLFCLLNSIPARSEALSLTQIHAQVIPFHATSQKPIDRQASRLQLAVLESVYHGRQTV